MSDAARAHNLRLTRGLAGPVAALDPIYLELIAELLRECWRCLHSDHLDLLLTESEPRVTMLLESWLQTDGRNGLKDLGITTVTRGSESTSADGESFERRPDLNLHFSGGGGADRFPLSLECKILDHNTSNSIALYFSNGVQRFVEGTYAWGRREAMMVAYVRDTSCLPLTVNEYL